MPLAPINCKTFTILIIHIAASCIYPVQLVCTSLFIKSSVYCFALFILLHILLFIFSSSLPIFTYILLLCNFFFCTVHWSDLTWVHFTSDYTLYNWVCDEPWTLNLPQYEGTNQNAAHLNWAREQNRPGTQTYSMLKKQGRWVQNRIRTWWPKKACCMLFCWIWLLTYAYNIYMYFAICLF